MRKKNASSQFIKLCFCQALIKLMKSQKYNDISISSICENAGFGRTTYYRYFGNNKDDLILYISNVYWTEFKEKNKEEAMNNDGKLLLKHIYNHKNFFLLLVKQDLLALMFKIFFQEYKRKDDENESLTYGKAFFAGGYFGIIYQWLLNDCKDSPDEIERKFYDGFLFMAKQKESK
ncbi:MAG: TetR/AcrR family transcriptional regulator [Bacilli bacterium]